VDPALWEEIERLAAQEPHSANAQAEYLLREALAKPAQAASISPRPLRSRTW
jgi:hypothetical protein